MFRTEDPCRQLKDFFTQGLGLLHPSELGHRVGMLGNLGFTFLKLQRLFLHSLRLLVISELSAGQCQVVHHGERFWVLWTEDPGSELQHFLKQSLRA